MVAQPVPRDAQAGVVLPKWALLDSNQRPPACKWNLGPGDWRQGIVQGQPGPHDLRFLPSHLV